MFARLLAVLLATIPAGAAQAQEPVATPSAEIASRDYLYWRPASAEERPRPWAILLPGGSGIDIFGDGGAYYFGFADWLNERGFDVLVVHYQEAELPPKDGTVTEMGAQIAAVALDSVKYERSLGRMDLRCDGLVFGWSMGGLGMWEIVGNGRIALPGLAHAFAFYPAVPASEEAFAPRVGVTVFQGDRDQLTPMPALETFVRRSTMPAAIEVRLFPGASHGFDLHTLAGPEMDGRLVYDPESAAKAMDALGAELDKARFGCGLD